MNSMATNTRVSSANLGCANKHSHFEPTMRKYSSFSKTAVLVTLAVLSSQASLAMMPLSDESILCAYSHVVLGTVVKATRVPVPNDCRQKPADCGHDFLCQPEDRINFVIKINHVVAISNKGRQLQSPAPNAATNLQKVAVGRVFNLTADLYNWVCSPASESQGKIGLMPPSTQPVSPRILNELFVGRQYIFAFTPWRVFANDPQNASEASQYNDSDPVFTGMWRMARATWVRKTLKASGGEACPRLVSR
jgi:hypothetical protein